MKALRKATYKRTMLDLDEWVSSVKEHADIIFDWKSPIHLRLIIDGYWLDLWPTTGKWYDFFTKQSGTGILAMSESVAPRLDVRPFVLSHIPPPPAEFPKKQRKESPSRPHPEEPSPQWDDDNLDPPWKP